MSTCAASILFFLLGSELLIRAKVAPQDLFEKHRHLFFNSDKTNAVFGDSHGAQGFTGEPDFVNLSFPSESIDIIYKKIKLYFKSRTPHKVVLQADPHLFSDYRMKERADDYVELFKNPRLPYFQILTPRHQKFLLYYWKNFLAGSDFKNHFQMNPDGSQMMDKKEKRSHVYDLQGRIFLQRPRGDFEKSHSMKKYFEVLDYLKSRNADVCLVTFPVSPAYVEAARKFPEFEKARQFLEKIAAQHGFRYASYWDAFSDAGMFVNEDHLGIEGARQLTGKIMTDCFHGKN